jgi:hypothetical protein
MSNKVATVFGGPHGMSSFLMKSEVIQGNSEVRIDNLLGISAARPIVEGCAVMCRHTTAIRENTSCGARVLLFLV